LSEAHEQEVEAGSKQHTDEEFTGGWFEF